MTPEQSIETLRHKCAEQINRFKAATTKREQVAALASVCQIYGSIRAIAIQFEVNVDLERFEKAINAIIRTITEE